MKSPKQHKYLHKIYKNNINIYKITIILNFLYIYTSLSYKLGGNNRKRQDMTHNQMELQAYI